MANTKYIGFNVVCTVEDNTIKKGDIFEVVSERYCGYFGKNIYELNTGLLLVLDGRPLTFKALMAELQFGCTAKFVKSNKPIE